MASMASLGDRSFQLAQKLPGRVLALRSEPRLITASIDEGRGPLIWRSVIWGDGHPLIDNHGD